MPTPTQGAKIATTPLWLSILLATLVPVASILAVIVTSRLARVRERSGQVADHLAVLHAERRDAYIGYLTALELLSSFRLNDGAEPHFAPISDVVRDLYRYDKKIDIFGSDRVRKAASNTFSLVLASFKAASKEGSVEAGEAAPSPADLWLASQRLSELVRQELLVDSLAVDQKIMQELRPADRRLMENIAEMRVKKFETEHSRQKAKESRTSSQRANHSD